MDTAVLSETVSQILSNNKGILATDATQGSMDKRMKSVGIEPTDELRRKFREIILTTPGFSEFIGGVILNDEIIRQKVSDGKSFVELLNGQGVAAGIKVDMKAYDMANFPGEKVTEGLDGLRDRFKEYKEMGAKFAKWRAVITIGESIPTQTCIESNAEGLARYAALAQEADIVPIVEPEVVMDGNHSIDRCLEVSSAVLQGVFHYLGNHTIFFPGMLLKPNMILPGEDSEEEPDVAEVAQKTLEVLMKRVPKEVGGVVFLSGGQDDKLATARLNEMNKMGTALWPLSFSFERALEGAALAAWKADDNNVSQAHEVFLTRAQMNSLARKGEYPGE